MRLRAERAMAAHLQLRRRRRVPKFEGILTISKE